MKIAVTIPEATYRDAYKHLFQNELEQGAFLFAETDNASGVLHVLVREHYLVPASGWELQADVFLEMQNEERARIMRRARQSRLAIVDCHSHPMSRRDVAFSASDRAGIAAFAKYVQWKLDGSPYVAMVWGRESIDAVAWLGDFAEARPVDDIVILGDPDRVLRPTSTWHRPLEMFRPRPRG